MDNEIPFSAVISNPTPLSSGSPDFPTEGASFHIVGVGASAGGLEALEQFFEHIPVHSGMAFVVVQHLSPDFKSLMDELLARHTSIPIRRVEDGMLVEPDAIYLIPPRKEMIISAGRLLLTDKDPAQSLHLPIDIFLRSLAQDAGTRSVAVILSGTGSDGSRGLRAVHEAGGLVIVQDEQSARFNGMPKSAIETGFADLILPPQAMGEALLSHINHLGDAGPVDGSALSPQVEVGLAAIFRGLRGEFGIDFAHYKPTTVWRRIERRLAMGDCANVEDYAARLANDPVERSALYKDLLIGVTKFFRDREAFERLEHDIIPQILQRAKEGSELRVWVAGCATGEEAYSLAMLIHERLSAMRRLLNVKIFATDVHRASLDFASVGAYEEAALSEVSSLRLERYFTRQGASLRVSPDLRKLIVFAPHNIIKDAPFTKLDLISCRNLLIYLQPAAQQKAISLFHFGLNTGGVLFLGPSENLGELTEEFDALDERWKLYRKRRDIRLPAELRLPTATSYSRIGASAPVGSSGAGLPDGQYIRVYDALLSEYMPPSVLVNERRELLHAFGGAGQYLAPRDGRASTDILDMVDRDARLALAGALQRASKQDSPITFSGVRFSTPTGEKLVRITVKPLVSRNAGSQNSLVVFEDLEKLPAEPVTSDKWDAGQVSNERMQSLELELKYTKENLQATIEELETSNEELQATNEELVASNEELQSTNEELHSVNEELYTVNAEHQRKIVELTELTDDMDNLLRSTQIGTLFLDSALCVRKYTPAITHSFNLLPQDVGRRIEDFSHSLEHPALLDDLRHVLRTGERLEREVQNRGGQWFLMRVLPYHSEGKTQDGVVVTFIDVSLLKQASETLRENIASRSLAEAEAREAVVRRDQFLAMLSHELRNPLGAILTSAAVLQRPDVSAAQAQHAREVVQRQAGQMATLLNDLLDVSRVTQGKIEIRCQRVDLCTVLRDAVECVEPLFAERQQIFEASFVDTPCFVMGDPARLRQVHVNLLNNAAKYTPPRGRIWLTLATAEQEAIIRVRDSGAGIPRHLLESIFELFVQSNSTLDRSDGGMGVGLTLVRSLVAMHGGSVSASSAGPGQGSEFVVRLPLCLTTPGETGSIAPVDTTKTRAAPRKILIVEDNADSREMLRDFLRLEGHEVWTAADGPEGIASIENLRPDVALIDIGLPGVDGYQLARHVRQASPQLPTLLVALTGYGRPSDRQAVLSAGFDGHLVKPLQFSELDQFLRSFECKS